MTKLLNVIGGLEKHTIPKMSMFIDGVEIGHNQLCNRQVEVDELEIAKRLLFHECGMRWESINDEEKEKWLEDARVISKAIEQGKVLKVIE